MKRRSFIKSVGAGGLTVFSSPLFTGDLFANGASSFPLETAYFKTVSINRFGSETAKYEASAKYFSQKLSENISIDMMLIPTHSDVAVAAHKHQSLFFVGKTPITQAQWRVVAGWPSIERELPEEPSFNTAADHPVECVSWLDVKEFCKRLSLRSGRNFHLLSEAQWQHSCRAGTKTPFHFGDTLVAGLANYGSKHVYASEAQGEYRGSSTPVASFLPNAFGLHDMHGNVWEWCADDIHYSNVGTAKSGVDTPSVWHPLRGGAWPDKPEKLKYSSRTVNKPNALNRIIGFRVGCTV